MLFIRKRLPSRDEAILLFISCAFMINIWSYFNLLRAMPSLISHVGWTEILAISSYTLAFALFESIIVFLLIVFLGFVLPKVVIRENWVPNGTAFAFITGLFVISYHYFPTLIPAWNNLILTIYKLTQSTNLDRTLIFGGQSFILIWILLFVLLLIGVHRRIRLNSHFAESITGFVNRLVVLTSIYLVINVFCAIIVMIRIQVL